MESLQLEYGNTVGKNKIYINKTLVNILKHNYDYYWSMLVLAEMGYNNFCNPLPVYEGGARKVKLIFSVCNSAEKLKLVNTSKTKVTQIGLHLQILQLI